MVKNEDTFLSHDGQTPIHTVEWLPEGAVTAVVQIAHGIAEYVDRYEPLAAHLTDQGFAVVGNDHIGHGQSLAPGAPAAYFGPKGSWNYVVDDLYTLRDRAGRRFARAPYFLLGHSMGSFLARTYLIRYPGSLNGAALMGSGWMSSAMLLGGKIIAARECHRVGETRPSPVVGQLSFNAYNKRFAPNRTAYDWLSVSRENVDRYLADPLCGGDASTGLFRELLDGLTFIQRPEALHRMNRHTPVLFLSGSMDPVGDCGKGVQKAVERFRRAGMLDVQYKLYPGFRHEILNDRCQRAVYQDLCAWLASHMPDRGAVTTD